MNLDNERLVTDYGFAWIANPADRVRIAWALVDGLGVSGTGLVTMMTRWQREAARGAGVQAEPLLHGGWTTPTWRLGRPPDAGTQRTRPGLVCSGR